MNRGVDRRLADRAASASLVTSATPVCSSAASRRLSIDVTAESAPDELQPTATGPVAASAAPGDAEQQVGEAEPEVFGDERVDDRVETAVEVGETGAEDLERDQPANGAVVDDRRWMVGGDEHGDVERQPAGGERHDDAGHHAHHAPTSPCRLGARRRGCRVRGHRRLAGPVGGPDGHLESSGTAVAAQRRRFGASATADRSVLRRLRLRRRRPATGSAATAVEGSSTGDAAYQQEVENADGGQRQRVADAEEGRVEDAAVGARRCVVDEKVDAVRTVLRVVVVLIDAVPRRTVAAADDQLYKTKKTLVSMLHSAIIFIINEMYSTRWTSDIHLIKIENPCS